VPLVAELVTAADQTDPDSGDHDPFRHGPAGGGGHGRGTGRSPAPVAGGRLTDTDRPSLDHHLNHRNGAPMTTWLGQYCINVTDLDRTVAFYEALGLECTSRTEIEHALEAIIEHPGRGRRCSWPSRRTRTVPSTWAAHVEALRQHRRHRHDLPGRARRRRHDDLGPERMERWPVTIAFVTDPDGYQVELVERHPWPDA
jgi:catechol 2,3-dioxygenase-like lactoylglutathione lyase family enzyme